MIGKGIRAMRMGGAFKVSVGQAGKEAGVIGSAIEDVNHLVERGLGKTVRGLKSGLTRETPATFYNGYTGLAPTKKATLGAFGVAAAYGGITSLKAKGTPVAGQTEYGEAPIMTADGMGASRAPNLGASGSLVFGLNSMRRG
jgi:hypothetical protein